MKYVSVCCRSDGGDECMTPEMPPIVNIAMRPMANFIDVGKRSEPPYIVAIQLKIFTPVGRPMSIVVSEKIESATAPMPTENMWCAQTPKPRKPIIAPEYTITL